MIKEKLKAILKNKITIAILAIMLPFLIEILMFRKIEINKVCEGLTFVITGSLHQYKNRNELINTIESLGGKVVGSISKNTKYLINNDATSESAKNVAAKRLGIPVITEVEFISKFIKK